MIFISKETFYFLKLPELVYRQRYNKNDIMEKSNMYWFLFIPIQ